LGKRVVAGIRALGSIDSSRYHVPRLNGGVRHHGAGGVGDSAGDGAAVALCEGW
jgi:hypothetical protein